MTKATKPTVDPEKEKTARALTDQTGLTESPKHKRSAPQDCKQCGVTMEAYSSKGETTYWKCQTPGCSGSAKTERKEVVKLPICPYCKRPCRLDKERGVPCFNVFVCPVEGCSFFVARPKPGLTPQRIQADEADEAGVSAR